LENRELDLGSGLARDRPNCEHFREAYSLLLILDSGKRPDESGLVPARSEYGEMVGAQECTSSSSKGMWFP